ncbi:hypothetical protein F383_15238 [Gossypium arboreum]|uniref:Uncharacterized protein n=1 Tax=Gossypium arboreum TaxID=29729 RepID=A0A0B0NBZ0_GOSAR|nr:hypothetical protein F383_15238 [Gossypium arboreum]
MFVFNLKEENHLVHENSLRIY